MVPTFVGAVGPPEGVGQTGVAQLVVGQERVVPVPRGVPALGHAHHDDQVEVEAVDALEVAHLDAPAEAAHPPGRAGQLIGQDPTEPSGVGRSVDRVEVGHGRHPGPDVAQVGQVVLFPVDGAVVAQEVAVQDLL